MDRRRWGACASIGLASCLQLGTGTGPQAGAGTSQGQSGAAVTSADAGPPSGTGCVQDPTGQVPLCESVSACSAVAVDPGAFPHCGFRFDSLPALDVECVCGDALCPLGAPRTCEDVAQLLSSESVLSVCEQVSAGRCLPLQAADAAASTGCGALCQSECSGVQDCLRLCGC